MSNSHPQQLGIGPLLKSGARALARLYDARLRPVGITASQLEIMRALSREKRLGLSRLAEKMQLDRTSIYRALAPMERKGWISLTQGSGRTRFASLTPGGSRAFRSAETTRLQVEAEIASEIGQESLSALNATLDALSAYARRQQPIAEA